MTTTSTRTKVLAPVAIIVAGIALIGLAAGILVIGNKQSTKEVPLTTLTKQVLTAAERYRTAPSILKSAARSSFISIAQKRLQRLRSLIAAHPDQVLNAAITKDTLSKKIPTELQSYTEQWITEVSGEYGLMTSDDFVNKKAKTWRIFTTTDGKKTYNLYPTGELNTPQLGLTRVTGSISGVLIGSDIALAPATATVDKPATQEAAAVTGPQRTLVVRVNFTDYTQANPTVAALQDAVFNRTGTTETTGSVNSFYQESSYNLINVTGDVIGPYTIPLLRSAGCNPVNVWDQTIGLIDGYTDFSQIDHLIVVAPITGCGFAGITTGRGSVNTGDGVVQISRSMSTGGVYILTHEYGHQLGLGHANFLDCSNSSFGTDPYSSNCISREYYDLADVMGLTYTTHINAEKMGTLGWFSSENLVTLAPDADLGTHCVQDSLINGRLTATCTIEPIETCLPGVACRPGDSASSGLKSVRVPRAWPNDYLYIEYRQPYGFDTALPSIGFSGNDFTSGALVHVHSSDLVDTTASPSTPGDYYSPALIPGTTIQDPMTTAVVTALSVISNPIVTISGGNGTGAKATTTVNGSAVNSLTLTNHGSGYTFKPAVAITGGAGSGAQATATLTPSAVGALSVVNGGSGYTSPPSVSITDSNGTGSGASATAVLASTSVQSITVTNGGSNYNKPPAVTIAPPDGSGSIATATATVQNKVVTAITITNPGSGYTSPPAVTIAPPSGPGTRATAASTLATRSVSSLTLTNGGTNFTSPTVTIASPGGSGTAATATVALVGTSIASLTLTSGGSGYSFPSLTVRVTTGKDDVIPPTLSLDTVPSGTTIVNNSVDVEAQASDSSGISKVEFYTNTYPEGETLFATVTSPPYTVHIDTSSYLEQLIRVDVRAYDHGGEAFGVPNNYAESYIYLNVDHVMLPDLAFFPVSDIDYQHTDDTHGILTARIKNWRPIIANNVPIKAYVNDDNGVPVEIVNDIIPSIPASDNIVWSSPVSLPVSNFTTPGNHLFTLKINPDRTIGERNYANNEASITLNTLSGRNSRVTVLKGATPVQNVSVIAYDAATLPNQIISATTDASGRAVLGIDPGINVKYTARYAPNGGWCQSNETGYAVAPHNETIQLPKTSIFTFYAAGAPVSIQNVDAIEYQTNKTICASVKTGDPLYIQPGKTVKFRFSYGTPFPGTQYNTPYYTTPFQAKFCVDATGAQTACPIDSPPIKIPD